MKHMKSILISLALMALVSCSSDPVFHGMTNQQKENYAKAVAGEYTGTYTVVYSDGSSDDTKAIKTEGAQVTITDNTLQSVYFHDFPISRLSLVVKDPALAEALVSHPNIDLTATYRFYDLQDNGDVNWSYNDFTVPLTLHIGDAVRHLLLKVSSSSYIYLTKENLDAGTPFANQRSFELHFDGIYEGSTLVEDFNLWQDGNATFLVFFQMDDKS